MKKVNIAYWIVTILFAGFMIFSSVDGIMVNERSVQFMEGLLHFPKYMIPFISWAKILGVIAILVPGFPRIKEWAYAGFFFAMSGAVFSHAAVGDSSKEFFGPVLLIILTVISWYFRPLNRKAVLTTAT